MKTAFVICLLCLLLGLSQEAAVRQLSGVCGELCPEDGCPEGTSCRSNGCGHECLLAAVTLGPESCPHRPVCDIFCVNNYKTGADGCPICACA